VNIDLKVFLLGVIFLGILVIVLCIISICRMNWRRKMEEKSWFEKAQADAINLDPVFTKEAETFINQTGKKNSWLTFIAGMKNKIRFKYPRKILLPIEIGEPPCKNCSHWMPRVGDIREDEIISVRICWSENMRSDFTCFEEKI
jgi:hypothetical protein